MTAHKPLHLVPQLRFPEFRRAGDWKHDQIGNVASITKGKGVSKADITKGGVIPCIRYAELYTHYREVIHEVVSRTNIPHEDLMLSLAEDVIVPASGETRADIARAACVLPERVALGSDLNILRSDLYGPFFSYLLNSPLRHTIARMAQGDTVAHLYPKQLTQVWLAYPMRLEQQKIADCLGSLDDLIAAEGRKLDALRQHKQGLMQQLFPRPGETVPQLRFPEFEDAPGWRQATIGEFSPFSYGKSLRKDIRNLAGHIPVFGSNGHVGWHDKALTDGPTIIIGRKGTVGAVHYSPVPCWPIDTTFFVSGSDAELVRFKYYALNALGLAAMNTDSAVPGLNRKACQARELRIPPQFEQRVIADCLGSLDDLIAAEGRKLDALRQHKQGLMQKLFPSLDGQ